MLGKVLPKTRKGTVFSGWLDVAVDFVSLFTEAINAGAESTNDHALDDDLDGLEPLLDPSGVDNEFDNDPLNQVDSKRPASPSTSQPAQKKRKRAEPIFEDVVAAGKPPNGHRRRTRARDEDIKARGHLPRKSTVEEHVTPAVYVPTPYFDALALPTTASAYLAKAETAAETRGSKKRRSLAEMLAAGFQLVKWDGIKGKPLVDVHGRIFSVLVGQPDQPGYRTAVSRAYATMKKQLQDTHFPASFRKHRRGLFAAINVGLTLGAGQSDPTWLDGGDYSEVAERLLADDNIDRMAQFADAAFAMWAPRLYDHYSKNNERLDERCPGLRRPFARSVFCCTAFNLGLNIWTFKHRDIRNLPYGWCAVQALGNFDATKGGHLILWDVKLVVEFPAGALILLPSATIAHSNIPVQDGDERMSFTQFTAGGLFQYTDNDGRTQGKFAQDDPKGFAEREESRKSRWAEGLEMFSTLEEITKK